MPHHSPIPPPQQLRSRFLFKLCEVPTTVHAFHRAWPRSSTIHALSATKHCVSSQGLKNHLPVASSTAAAPSEERGSTSPKMLLWTLALLRPYERSTDLHLPASRLQAPKSPSSVFHDFLLRFDKSAYARLTESPTSFPAESWRWPQSRARNNDRGKSGRNGENTDSRRERRLTSSRARTARTH